MSAQTFRRRRMNETGIGLAGLDGVWWLPASEPFRLPARVLQELHDIGKALFTFFDTVTSLFGTGQAAGLDECLSYKVPSHIPRLIGPGQVQSVRPDFQLYLNPEGRYQPVLTELEICPSAQGFAHAMQVGYGLPTDLVENFVQYLNGRELLIVGSQQWSEFILEQLAFCRALAGRGVKARVLYDIPISVMAGEIRREQRWRPPMFAIREKPPEWNLDLMARLQAHQFHPYLWPADGSWPEAVGQAVVFRFGYFDCFSPERLHYFLQWQARGATLLNPVIFILDSKVLLAALQLPFVRERLAQAQPGVLGVLDRCIPETYLLQPEVAPRLRAEKDEWVIKYAGFDSQNQAWGGRSLHLGLTHTEESWGEVLEAYLALPWPTVAQRLVPSTTVDIAYADAQERLQVMRQGRTRLRTFMLRDPQQPGQLWVGGSHLTVSSGTMNVSETVDTVQAPIVFEKIRKK